MTNEVKLFDITDTAISELKQRYIGLTVNGLEDVEGYKAVKAARIDMKGYRVAVDKRRKELNEDALKHQRLINGEAKRITDKLSEIEDYLANQEKKIDDMVAEIKRQEAVQRELKKIARIDQLLNVGFKYNGNMFGSNKDILLLDTVMRMDDEEFKTCIERYEAIHQAAEAKRIEEESERKRLQEEAQAELALERERIAAERAENEAKAKALAEHERALKEESARIFYEKQAENLKSAPVMPIIENKPMLGIDQAEPGADKTVFRKQYSLYERCMMLLDCVKWYAACDDEGEEARKLLKELGEI